MTASGLVCYPAIVYLFAAKELGHIRTPLERHVRSRPGDDDTACTLARRDELVRQQTLVSEAARSENLFRQLKEAATAKTVELQLEV